jgi:hypothetical protein
VNPEEIAQQRMITGGMLAAPVDHRDIYDPYRIEVDEEGINKDIARALIELARTWPTHMDHASSQTGFPGDEDRRTVTVPCERCNECDGRIFPENLEGRLHHLFLEHGYRMDGSQFNGKNELVGHA